MPTVMAKQRVLRFMINQRHGTVGALQHMAASAAHANGLVAAAVQQQNALFPALQISSEFLHHPLADFPRVPGGKFGAHINKINRWQRATAITVGQRNKPHPATYGGVIGFGARRGGRKQQQGMLHHGALFGNVMGGIAWGGFALVGVFLFLI